MIHSYITNLNRPQLRTWAQTGKGGREKRSCPCAQGTAPSHVSWPNRAFWVLKKPRAVAGVRWTRRPFTASERQLPSEMWIFKIIDSQWKTIAKETFWNSFTTSERQLLIEFPRKFQRTKQSQKALRLRQYYSSVIEIHSDHSHLARQWLTERLEPS